MSYVKDGMEVIVDGFKGEVICNPEPEIQRKYQQDLSDYLKKHNK